MMKIGIGFDSYTHAYGLERGLEKMREHGYETVDYGNFSNTDTPLFQGSEEDFEKTLKYHRGLLEGLGFEITQVHGPWRWPINDSTPELRAERFEKMSKSIRGTAILGCKNFVVHNIMPFGGEDADYKIARDMNADYYGRLLIVAKEYGVTICLENMPFLKQGLAKPADMLAFVKSFHSPNMRMCLDTGHVAVHGLSAADAVRLIGKEYLNCMHVHDNNGQSDLHWLPYTGVIDWDDFSAALKEIGYEGSVSLETAVGGDYSAELEEKQRALAKSALKIAGRA